MHFWIITFFFGVCTLSFCTDLPNLYWLLILPPIFLLRLSSPIKIKKFITHILVFAIGFCWALTYTRWNTAWNLPSELDGKKILITGKIASIPINKPHYLSFEFQTDIINGTKKSTKLKLGWYGEFPKKLLAGDRWQLLVKLKRPHTTLNPGSFDLEKHLLVHHIRGTGYVVDSDFNQILATRWQSYPLTKLRQCLIKKIQQTLSSNRLMPIIIALVTGSEHEITQTEWEIMRNTGTSYLVAISGLHIGLVAAIVLTIIQFLWRKIKRLPLILPAREAGIIAGLFAGFVYGAVSGLSIPTQRALVMLSVFSLTSLLRRHTQPWNAWLWSLFLVLVIDPLAELTIGFWLSFSAVAAIIYATSWRIKQKTTHWHKFWRMQLIVTIALLPLTLLFFQQFSLVTLIANLIAMPGVCIIVVPLCLLGSLCLLFSNFVGTWILILSSRLLHLIWWWLTIFSQFPNNSWYQPIYNWWILAAATVGILLLLAPRGFPAKYLGLVWLLPLFFYVPAKPKLNEAWFTLLDVGQGLAAVVQTTNHVLLYDTGPRFLDHNAGITIILPYLRLQGVQSIDTMIVSHGDVDHSGGSESILKTLPVRSIVTSAPEKFISFPVQSCIAGQSWQWDGIDFQMLSPPQDSQLSGNEASCVLKITRGTDSILLTGDIERTAEDILINNYGTNLKSNILVAPHHGSATSSTNRLIDMVAPKYVLFSAGYRNRFHFPNKKIVARYLKSGCELLNTAYEGAITFKLDGKSAILTPLSYRKIKQRFWNNLKNE